MQSHLHTSADAIEWVVAGYGLSFAVLLVTAGRLGDRYGHRRVLSTGMALFIAASTACGLAPDPAVLIAGRLVQGAAAALISPSVLSLIGVLYTGQARVKAIATYGTSLGVAAAAGQLIGGALIQADIAGAGWRAVFLINVPVGLIALALTRPLVAESRATTAHRVDVSGTVLLVAGLTALVLPLIEGRQLGWPTWSWASLAVCRRACWPPSPSTNAGWRAEAGHRSWTHGRSSTPRYGGGWSPSSGSGADRRRSTWCSPCTYKTAVASALSPRAWCSPYWRCLTWPPRSWSPASSPGTAAT
jgi:MFS family permease